MTFTDRVVTVALCAAIAALLWPAHSATGTEPEQSLKGQRYTSAIVSYRPIGCVRQGRELTLNGRAFGPERGDRSVVLRGPGEVEITPEVTRWTNEQIAIAVPTDARFEPGEVYALQIRDDTGATVSNRVPVDLCLRTRLRISSVLPGACVEEGKVFSLFGSGFGPEQRHRQLVAVVGERQMPLDIKEWTEEKVTAVFPEDARVLRGSSYVVGFQNAAGDWLADPSMKITVCD